MVACALMPPSTPIRFMPASRGRPSYRRAFRPSQRAQDREVAEIGRGLRLLGGLQDLRHAGEALVGEQQAKRAAAEESAADVFVAVETGAERLPGVVEVKGQHA